MKHFALSVIVIILFAVPAIAAEDGFVSLFNGQDTTGWKSVGGKNKFYAEDGQLVAESDDEVHLSYIITEKEFSNFILKAEFKYEAPVNSGLQFRGIMHGQDVWGYQAEITVGKNNALLWDEGPRGGFVLNDEQLQKKTGDLYKANDWNTIEVQAVGPSLKSKLNGTLICDVLDVQYDKGFIGFQIHESKTKGKIRFRNIQIIELPATPWISLYANGKFGALESKCDWVQTDDDTPFGSFVPKPVSVNKILPDGSLSSSTPPNQPEDGILVSRNIYKNFAVKVSFKMEQGNSGLYFRAKENDKAHWLSGFQCEIAMSPAVNAALWEVDGRGWVKKTKETEAVSTKATKQKEWNDIAAVAIGDHLVTLLNGQKVMDIIDPNPTHGKQGKVGLQLHGGGNQGCLFNNFYIMPLSEEVVKLIQE
jgi:hypothetical protein